LAAVFVFSGYAYAADNIKVTIDGEQLVFAANEAGPVQQDGRVLVPMRNIFEALDMYVQYASNTCKIYTRDNKAQLPTNLEMQLGNKEALVRDSYTVALDVPPKATNGTTYVPLRFIAETAYADVVWDADNRTVEITRQKIKGIDQYVAEDITKTITIGDRSMDTYMYNLIDPNPVIVIYIDDKEDIDSLINASTEDDLLEINSVFGNIAVACGKYYNCNVTVEIRSKQYKTYSDLLRGDYYYPLIKTTYKIGDAGAITTWYYN